MVARRPVGAAEGRAALAAVLTALGADEADPAGAGPGAALGPRATGSVEGVEGADRGASGRPPVDRATTRTAVRWLLEELSRRAPGSAVEVRVPPFAAIQAVAGPSHRRGTPSAVVELDATTWIALATGALTWQEGIADGRVVASGERADLSPWLPLLRPPIR